MTDANDNVELQAILAEYTDKMANISTDIDEADQIALKNEAFRIFTEKAAEINKTKSNQSVSSSPLVGSSTTTIVAEAATKNSPYQRNAGKCRKMGRAAGGRSCTHRQKP